MNYWNANLAVIEGNFPGLAEQLLRLDDETLSPADIVVKTTPSGAPTLLVRGVYLHSPRDPAREGRHLAETAEQRPVIVLGFGLGYVAEAVAAATDKPLIIVERHRALFKTALETRDLTGFFTRSNMTFLLGASSALPTLDLAKHQPCLLRNRALIQLDQAWYADLERRILTTMSAGAVNQATLKRFGVSWERNLSRNITAIRDIPGVITLAGLLKQSGIPVLLLAAGPSLDMLFPLLPELAKRCVVIAVDTALRQVLEWGVQPDFSVVVDPQYWNFRHLDRAPAPKTCLIAESAVYPAVLRHVFARQLLCASHFPLGRFIEQRLEDKGALGAGGSVATTAWDFARLLQPASIWIGGLDLSFPELKTHFKGALFETRALSENTRLTPLETWSVRALRDGSPFVAPAANGGTVHTDHRLSLYAAWFEKRLPFGPPTYRFGDKGLAIAGLRNASPETLLTLPEQRDAIERLLTAAFSAIDATQARTKPQRAQRYEAAMQELFDGLERIRLTARDAASLADEAYRRMQTRRPFPQEQRERVLQKLESAGKSIKENRVKDVAGFLFPPLEELESTSADPFTRHLEFSRTLYRSLSNTAGALHHSLTRSE
jgi:hypothetical protein